MLAGIYDPHAARNPGGSIERLAAAFGTEVAARAVSAGPIAIVADLLSDPADGAPAGAAVHGPIYNLATVAQQLGLARGAASAEVLAAAYEQWGDELLHRLRGAFALAAWPADGSGLLLAQDQVGGGAMFVHAVGRELVFASEIRDLLPLLRQRPGPDEIAVVRSLAGALLWDGRTIYENVRRLGAGHRLVIHQGRRSEERYWYPRYQPPLTVPRPELAAQLRSTLMQSVGTRAAEPDEVGIMLSGGFDSGSVAAAAAAVRGPDRPPVRGYSASFPGDPRMDETDLLDTLRDELGITNVRFEIRPGGAVTLALGFTRDWSLPLSGPGWVIEYALARRAAADGVSVLLDGQSGDELFGMSPYLLADLLRRGRIPSMLRLARHGIPGAGRGLPWEKVAKTLRTYALTGAAPGLYRAFERINRRSARDAPEWLSTASAGVLAASADPVGQLLWAKAGEPRWWSYLAYILVEGRDGAGVGDYVRQRAAWVGIEARPPLLDVELIEMALRIPPEYAFDNTYNRPFAREALTGLLPDTVRLSRRKSNLAPLYHAGLTGPDLPLIRRLLTSKSSETRRWVCPEVIARLLDNPPTPRKAGWYEWMNAVWSSVSVECWLRTQADADFPERLLREEGVQEPAYAELDGHG